MIAGGAARKVAIRPAAPRAPAIWAASRVSRSIGSSRNWARPTAATSSPMLIAPLRASRPLSQATTTRKRPVSAVVPVRWPPSAVAATSRARSAVWLARAYAAPAAASAPIPLTTRSPLTRSVAAEVAAARVDCSASARRTSGWASSRETTQHHRYAGQHGQGQHGRGREQDGAPGRQCGQRAGDLGARGDVLGGPVGVGAGQADLLARASRRPAGGVERPGGDAYAEVPLGPEPSPVHDPVADAAAAGQHHEHPGHHGQPERQGRPVAGADRAVEGHPDDHRHGRLRQLVADRHQGRGDHAAPLSAYGLPEHRPRVRDRTDLSA